MRKLRLRDVRYLAQGHTSKWKGTSPGSRTPDRFPPKIQGTLRLGLSRVGEGRRGLRPGTCAAHAGASAVSRRVGREHAGLRSRARARRLVCAPCAREVGGGGPGAASAQQPHVVQKRVERVVSATQEDVTERGVGRRHVLGQEVELHLRREGDQVEV